MWSANVYWKMAMPEKFWILRWYIQRLLMSSTFNKLGVNENIKKQCCRVNWMVGSFFWMNIVQVYCFMEIVYESLKRKDGDMVTFIRSVLIIEFDTSSTSFHPIMYTSLYIVNMKDSISAHTIWLLTFSQFTFTCTAWNKELLNI